VYRHRSQPPLTCGEATAATGGSRPRRSLAALTSGLQVAVRPGARARERARLSAQGGQISSGDLENVTVDKARLRSPTSPSGTAGSSVADCPRTSKRSRRTRSRTTRSRTATRATDLRASRSHDPLRERLDALLGALLGVLVGIFSASPSPPRCPTRASPFSLPIGKVIVFMVLAVIVRHSGRDPSGAPSVRLNVVDTPH
jgi:hypothetical protein